MREHDVHTIVIELGCLHAHVICFIYEHNKYVTEKYYIPQPCMKVIIYHLYLDQPCVKAIIFYTSALRKCDYILYLLRSDLCVSTFLVLCNG